MLPGFRFWWGWEQSYERSHASSGLGEFYQMLGIRLGQYGGGGGGGGGRGGGGGGGGLHFLVSYKLPEALLSIA